MQTSSISHLSPDSSKTINLVFVVCHPDDEALWVGGLLHAFSQFDNIAVYVICLSGAGEQSLRETEFGAAKSVAGYRAGIVLGGALRSASQSLPPIADTVAEGIKKLDLQESEVDLLVTHSAFGEEHMHPHHIQSCQELFVWARNKNIPFGCFTCIPFPNANLSPILRNMKRMHALQPLNFAWSRYGVMRKLLRCFESQPWRYPLFYTQWLIDGEVKRNMLACYRSIDLAMHEKGYAMFTNNVESIYLYDQSGVDLFCGLLQKMKAPGAQDFFPGTWTDDGIKSRLARKFFFWIR